ncbi:YXWGXW repeat-containing protein [Sorangium sp. So ce406]|uniref:YXWGXW repeat-containing protein n=1 Tax=Sorangium sp. So ce406 TaxID=3133311 RepID=UPI003F5BCC9C
MDRRWMNALLRRAPGLALLLLVGCGSSLPVPPTGPHLPSEPAVVVPYPPPPARVEIISPPEKPGLVWIDGEWQWRSRRWAWQPGRWEPVPPGAYFAPNATVRRADGSLVWFAGVWHVPGKK